MKRYLLDNSVLVAYLKGREGALRLIRPWIAAREVATSQIVYGEAIEYMKGLVTTDRSTPLVARGNATQAQLPYERYAELRRAMRPPHGPGLIGDMDTLIAATALEHNLAVVPINGDYMRVPGLALMHLHRSALL